MTRKLPRSLPDERTRFLLDKRRVATLRKRVEPLKDAPLRVRRLGLPLAVATWSREGHDDLIQLLADWIFSEWGMLKEEGIPQGVRALLNRLMELDDDEPAIRSAIESEAEAFLQAAKLLSGAFEGVQNG